VTPKKKDPGPAPKKRKPEPKASRDRDINQHTLPARYRSALCHEIRSAMPKSWAGDFGEWLHANRRLLVRGGDPEGVVRFNYELADLDRFCDLLSPFKKMLTEAIPDALGPCGVTEFGLRSVECHATLHHHGSHCDWHTDTDPEQRLAFTYHMHSHPKMFAGGQLEFPDGTKIEPNDNTLVLFHPHQPHRINRVECWSGELLHGRWAISGWLLG
jgi:hypothetical protein